MADQDFKINIVTLADLTGIKLTQQQLDALQASAAKGNTEAIAALKKLTDAQKEAQAASNVGFTGSAVGLGTIVTLLTSAIHKWKEFNDEQDKWVEGMIKATEKAHELGLSIVDMQDKARNAARVAVEPLEQSFTRLTHDIAVLKTEIDIAFKGGAYEDVKKLTSELNVLQSLLDGVTSKLQRQKSEADKAAQSELEKRVPGLKPQDQVKEADAQTQAILKNEQAADKARAEGRDKEADQFQKSADEYKASATPQQLADLARIHELQDKLKGPAAPTYKPLSPEEFARQQEAAEPGGAGPKPTREEMSQHQLEARAQDYQDLLRAIKDSEIAAQKRHQEQMALWR